MERYSGISRSADEHHGFANIDAFTRKRDESHFRLDFNERAEGHLVNFYEPETANDQVFRWSEPVAMVRMNVPPNEYDVVIETASLRGECCPFPFKLFWNDQLIPRSQVQVTEGQIRFPVDRSMFIRNDEQRLTVSCKPLNAENGRRKLGMPIKWIRLNQLGKRSCEFSNPTKSRSRLWRQNPPPLNFRRLLGMKSPSPNLPIWEMKLPDVAAMLPVEPTDCPGGLKSTDTVIVSSVEINSRHGTGLLIQYLFEDFSDIATVSSHRCFHGDRVRSAVHYEVPFEEMKRHEIYNMVLHWFKDAPPQQAYVVPFYKTELLVAIALADLFETRVCIHVMDDQCLYENEISNELMREALGKANLVFTISPEMKTAYEARFGHKIHVLPPIVPESMILDRSAAMPIGPARVVPSSKPGLTQSVVKLFRRAGTVRNRGKLQTRGILIGNVWDPKWLEMLQTTISGSGHEVDWFSNNPDAMMLNGKADELAAAGIYLQSPLWGDDLVDELRQRPYALMPSGTLCNNEPRESVARLSLPSRVPFVTAVSQIPIIVLGSRETAAARFVSNFDLGATVDYDPVQFRQAVEHVLDPAVNASIQQKAADIAHSFSSQGLADWLWSSLKLGQPLDDRFDVLFSLKQIEATHGKPTDRWPVGLCNREDLRRCLRRLKTQGINPIRIIDVGAKDGAWSRTAAQVFPDAMFVLIEPFSACFRHQSSDQKPNSNLQFEFIEAALSDKVSRIEAFAEPADQDRRILGIPADRTQLQSTSIKMMRLDQLANSSLWTGSTLLRIDTSFVEHLVIAGGLEFIHSHVDAIMLEPTLHRKHPAAKTYLEILDLMGNIGFELNDEVAVRRCPETGRLKQKNVVFLKRDLVNLRRVA